LVLDHAARPLFILHDTRYPYGRAAGTMDYGDEDETLQISDKMIIG
jgi:hypothetical protein